MQLQESGEMYLETVLILSQNKEYVRSLDVAEYMDFSKPSVSRAVSNLKKGNYLTTDANGYLYLTESGEEIAKKIYERHRLLTEFLIHLGVDKETAAKDACRIEHVTSDETFEAIKRHAQCSVNPSSL